MARPNAWGIFFLSLWLFMLVRISNELDLDAGEKLMYSGELTGKNRLAKRAPTPPGCNLPSNLQTVKWNCTYYRDRVKCRQACVWGYTMPVDYNRDFRCIYNQDKWLPYDFRECQPFVNCNIKLKTAGSVNCTSNQASLPDNCFIYCHPYDEYEESPSKIYQCTLNGQWIPPLPFCAERAPSYRSLLPRPYR